MPEPNQSTSHLIGREWVAGAGPDLESTSPSDQSLLWQGRCATAKQVAEATEAARLACPGWRGLTVEQRINFVQQFAQRVKNNADELAQLISRENGKPLWEAKTEAAAVAAKAELAIDAFRQRRGTTTFDMDGYQAVTRYKPFGVMGVLGPFNFPAHLANGHIMPALIAGNTIVFKPSELTPAVGQWLVSAWQQIGLPPGVINLVQGGRDTGIALAEARQLDGLLFTGSSNAGCALHRKFGAWPQKMLALEMGGNNPLIVADFQQPFAAAYTILLSAFLTAGQRCTCARRLILIEDERTPELLTQLVALIARVRVGYWNDPHESFMGPVIHEQAGQRVVAAQQELIGQGAVPLVELQVLRDNHALLSPGVLDLTNLAEGGDREIFGPLLQVHRVQSFEQAIATANDTEYGLSAGLISDDRDKYEHFIHHIRAGVVNWNRQTTGASGRLPFGGCGLSGNHRPSGYFAADYCSWPVASLESPALEIPQRLMPGIDPD